MPYLAPTPTNPRWSFTDDAPATPPGGLGSLPSALGGSPRQRITGLADSSSSSSSSHATAGVAGGSRPRVLSVIGARPEIIQAAPVCEALAPLAEEILVHTGQHYDEAMSESQILATRLPRPRHNLGVGSRAREAQLDLARVRLEELIRAERPAAVIVRGDTNATLSGALAAAACGVPLVHVEAGLRSYRKEMPEEHNRIETDRLSNVLCAPTEGARRNLEAEGVAGEIHVTGDPLCDTLESWRARVKPAGNGDYLLATVHRNYNTDSPERLAAVLACLARAPLPVLFPLHPRTRRAIDSWGLRTPPNIKLIEPVPYTRMLELERGARAIATDSGGVQREAYLWAVRCITLREETEWVDTVATGWNTLVGCDPNAFAAALRAPLPAERPPIFGDGHAARRIAQIVIDYLWRSQQALGEGTPTGGGAASPVASSGAIGNAGDRGAAAAVGALGAKA
ncbi:MAG TPA: UDP-N-acetylglucosamine 2-epimerase (non-hydrolyzing) [Solirubrobacteraceae bacterium]|jgi:UDP-GlcNAc3NAcA epimerase|nr:UDP-N-acetylglucosamine 2-epimerase (non-hydrolyzing) [Solirubrobacteraceae bacterium]